jgi:hypothetical protein
MVKLLRTSSLAALITLLPACESVLDIPVGIRGSDRYVCEAQKCACTCGYVKCDPDEETCDSQCASRPFIPPPPDAAAFASTPALLVSQDTAYVAFSGQIGRDHGVVCSRGTRAGKSAPPRCVACPYAVGDVWLATLGGALFVAGRRGACVLRLPDLTSEPDLVPGPGRDISGMTTDPSRDELVWLEFSQKGGQPLSMLKRTALGKTRTITLAAHNRPTLLAADDGKATWKVLHPASTDCDTAPLGNGAGGGAPDACLVQHREGGADAGQVEARPFPTDESITALSYAGGSVYYTTKLQNYTPVPNQPANPIIATLRRFDGADPAKHPVIASGAAAISAFTVLPESTGESQLFYATLSGVVYGGPVNLDAPSGANVLALTGFGDSTQITALSAIKDTESGGYLTFFNGRLKATNGTALVPELRRLAVAPALCGAPP